MLCNGRTCKNNEIMRFGDNVACHYDAHNVGGKMIFIMKIDGFEKNFTRPDVYIYTMRPADVGRHLVQCIGYIDSSVSIMEINVVVTCAFRYVHGDPHHTEGLYGPSTFPPRHFPRPIARKMLVTLLK